MVTDITFQLTDNWFIPASTLADTRRRAVDSLLTARKIAAKQAIVRHIPSSHPFPTPIQKQEEKQADSISYLGNVMNKQAVAFYQQHGINNVKSAFELEPPAQATLMTCKHCIRYSLGYCTKTTQKKAPFNEPLFLVSSDGQRFRLQFDCKLDRKSVVQGKSVRPRFDFGGRSNIKK